MKTLVTVVGMVVALVAPASAAVLHEDCVVETVGPRAGQCRTAGWQIREMNPGMSTADSLNQAPGGGDGAAGGDGGDGGAGSAAGGDSQ